MTGYTRFIPNEEQLESNVVTRAHMEGQLVVALAGRYDSGQLQFALCHFFDHLSMQGQSHCCM